MVRASCSPGRPRILVCSARLREAVRFLGARRPTRGRAACPPPHSAPPRIVPRRAACSAPLAPRRLPSYAKSCRRPAARHALPYRPTVLKTGEFTFTAGLKPV